MSELKDSTNNQYHANRTHLSSSMLKLLLKDPQQFYREWVLGERNEEYNPAFVEGSLTHTLCLEPEKIDDYAVFPGVVRRGKAYEEFKKSTTKEIVTALQLAKAQKYTRACMNHEMARYLLTGGLPEHTMISEILGIPMKARADYINLDKDYIVDIKTTARPNNANLFRGTCVEYGYDLSAALYRNIASHVYDRSFDFYWVVISKQDLTCEVYKASQKTLSNGRILISRAVDLYNSCMETGEWKHHIQTEPENQPALIKEI